MVEDFKLKIELVPKTSWWKNVRSEVPKRVWDKIREEVCVSQDYKCGICGAGGRLECHEVWKYDDANHIQELEYFIALCTLCHQVKHIGRTVILMTLGKIDMQEIENHFVQVNKCDSQALRKHALEAGIQWQERSKYKWRLSLGAFESQLRGSEEEKAQKNTIIKELDELGSLRLQFDALESEKEERIDQILTPEIMTEVGEIKNEFADRSKNITEQIALLDAKIRNYVAQYGATISGTYLQATWSKGRINWDTKAIEEYSISNPEILKFRREGKPFVSIRIL